MKKSIKIAASILLILSLALCFASCGQTVETLLAKGDYSAALHQALKSGDGDWKDVMTEEKLFNYVSAITETYQEYGVNYKSITKANTFVIGNDSSDFFFWYTIELERSNGEKDQFAFDPQDDKFTWSEVDGEAKLTPSGQSIVTKHLGYNENSALILSVMIASIDDDKAFPIEMIARLNNLLF